MRKINGEIEKLKKIKKKMIEMNNNKTILIKEKDKKKIANVKFADSYFSRLKGLMFKKDLDYVLVLKPAKAKSKSASSIHSYFMRMAIDVIFLNEEKQVYEMKQLKPWKFFTPSIGASYILELKEGTIEKYKISLGDKLDFVCEFR